MLANRLRAVTSYCWCFHRARAPSGKKTTELFSYYCR